ncbi:MAG TPA: cytochrome c oxidase subunit II [Allosphingosinicella sp.]|nr:cytochrome c oxidase subunit II [Allosphingosinicella sp.]
MKTPLKLILAAAAFALAPAGALAQGAPASAPAASAPSDAISANSQVAPAQPEAMSPPVTPDEEPSNAQVLSSSAARTAPDAAVGQPTGAMGFQPQVTSIGQEALWFHDVLLLPIIAAISIFVLGLLLFVIVRYRRGANPVPSRTTHNTALEVVWTLVPVLILVAIAVPSIRLLAHQYDPPKADITVKATGNQWYWTYTYPDHGGFEIVSNGLSDADARKRGEPRLLAVDERMVVPAGATVKVIVTASDVIHSWGVPAFWTKMDAVPGRLNETWFKTDRPGIYYGQCFELCGARHAYMPIAVEVLPPAQFAAWVASKGGTMPGASPPAGPDSTAVSPVTNPAPAPGGSEATPEPTLTPGTATPPVTNQAAESSRGN